MTEPLASFDPHSLALRDHFVDGEDTVYRMVIEGGLSCEYRASQYFRFEAKKVPLQARALRACRGQVWDLGAAAGRHSLVLQERGHRVMAVDSSRLCVAIMRKRGVRNVGHMRIEEMRVGRVDTILLLDNMAGVSGTFEGLVRLLTNLQDRLNTGGQILADSYYSDAPEEARGYLAYKEHRGEPFDWMFVAPRSLKAAAHKVGLRCELIGEDGTGVLARLQPPGCALNPSAECFVDALT